MLKVILHHWHAQRQRPEPSVPIYQDELIVTKVNPIFDEEPAENATSIPKEEDVINNNVQESEKIRRRLFASGFDSLDSKGDPEATITDVVAEVHRPRSSSIIEDNVSTDSALPESKSEKDSSSEKSDEKKSPKWHAKLTPKVDENSTKVRENSPKLSDTTRSSFLHSKFPKKKEPRTSILPSTQTNPAKIETLNDIESVEKKPFAEKEVIIIEKTDNNEKIDVSSSPKTIDNNSLIEEESKPVNSETKRKEPLIQEEDNLEKQIVVSTSEEIEEKLLNENVDSKNEIPKLPLNPISIEPIVQLSENSKSILPIIFKKISNVSSSLTSGPIKSSTSKTLVPSSTAATTTIKRLDNTSNIFAILEKAKISKASHGEVLKTAILGNNLILKPSEVAKKERELRAAAKDKQETDIKIIKTNQPMEFKISPRHVQNDISKQIKPILNNVDRDRPPDDEEISVTATPKPPPPPPPSAATATAIKPIELLKPMIVKLGEQTEVKTIAESSFEPTKINEAITRSENSRQSEIRSSKIKAATSKREEICSECKKVHKNGEQCPEITKRKPINKLTTNEIPRFKKKGVTRGDQSGGVPGAEKPSTSTSSDNSPQNRTPLPERKRSEGDGAREKRFNGINASPKICRHCAHFGRRSVRLKKPLADLGKYDDYYLSAIRGARNRDRHGRHSHDSLSDISYDPRQGGEHRHHHHHHHHDHDRLQHQRDWRRYAPRQFRLPEFRNNGGGGGGQGGGYPQEGSAEDRFVFEDDSVNSSPNGKIPYGLVRCSSCGSFNSHDHGSETGSFTFEKRPQSFGAVDEPNYSKHYRASGKWKQTQIGDCNCGGHGAGGGHTARRVKFAAKNENDIKKTVGGGETGGEKTDETKTTAEKEEDEKMNDDKEAKVDEKTIEKETTKEKIKEKNGSVLKNGHFKTGYPQYPWEIEDWQMYMHKRHLEKRRRRALYMGIIALVIIIVIGMSVGLVMVWLRKKTF